MLTSLDDVTEERRASRRRSTIAQRVISVRSLLLCFLVPFSLFRWLS